MSARRTAASGSWSGNGRGATARRVVPVDNQRLDVEGLATIDRNGGRYLLAPSPTDNAYAVFRLPEAEYVGRFAAAAGSFDASSVTDGILAAAGDFSPPYPDGILPAQDGDNAPSAQNYRLERWDVIAAALTL